MEVKMDKVVMKKKFENYWYYYKIHTFVAIFVIIVLAVLIQQCASRVSPDITFVVATQKPVLSTDSQTSLQDYLQKLTADVNKDGKKNVECDFFTFNDSQSAMAYQVKLTAFLSSSDDIIYIFEDDIAKQYFKDQDNEGFMKITDIVPDLKLDDPYKLPIEDTKLADQSFGKSLSGLGIYVRSYNKSNQKASYVANINNQINMIKNIIK